MLIDPPTQLNPAHSDRELANTAITDCSVVVAGGFFMGGSNDTYLTLTRSEVTVRNPHPRKVLLSLSLSLLHVYT
jgi:hypothetical protein